MNLSNATDLIVNNKGVNEVRLNNNLVWTRLVTQDLLVHLDAGNSDSYGGSGTTWTDLQGNYNATLVNGPTYNSNSGSSFVLDGTNDYIRTTNFTSVLSSEIHTTELWIYPTNNGVLASYTSATTPSQNYHHSALELVSGKLEFGLWGGAILLVSSGPTETVSFNQWHQIVLTYDGTYCRGYIDGSLADTVTVTWDSPNVDRSLPFYMLIGSADNTSHGDGTYFNGKIGITRIYDRALSANEILQNFNANRSRYGI